MKINIDACYFVDLIAKRARDAWDYEMEEKEAAALEDLFDSCGEVDHDVNYYADNYVINGDSGKGGESLFDSYGKALEEIPDFLNNCLIVWGRSEIDDILDSDNTDEEKEKAIRSLNGSEFGFVVQF